MFQFRRFPSYTYLIQCTILEYCSSGFPHSEISGSMDICSSPKLIAACHVLRRLLMPRHSPCALYSLTYSRYFWFSFGLNYAGNHRSSSQNCHCYPLLNRSVPQLKFTTFFQDFRLKRPLCCLAFHHMLHCSVFKVHSSSLF